MSPSGPPIKPASKASEAADTCRQTQTPYSQADIQAEAEAESVLSAFSQPKVGQLARPKRTLSKLLALLLRSQDLFPKLLRMPACYSGLLGCQSGLMMPNRTLEPLARPKGLP